MLNQSFVKAFTTIACLSLFALNAAYAELPNAIEAGDEKLTLNGSGVRTKYLMQMYVAGLYLEQPSSDAAAIVDGDIERVAGGLRIIVVVSYQTCVDVGLGEGLAEG